MSNPASPRRTGPAQTCPASSLAQRARQAASKREPDPTGLEDPRWREHAARHAQILACMLGLDPQHVRYRRDPNRRYGRYWPGVLLQVTDPVRAHTYAIIPDQSRAFLALSPCPECGQPTPAARLAELAELAPLCPDRDGADPTLALTQRPMDIPADPAHLPGCPHRADDPATPPPAAPGPGAAGS